MADFYSEYIIPLIAGVAAYFLVEGLKPKFQIKSHFLNIAVGLFLTVGTYEFDKLESGKETPVIANSNNGLTKYQLDSIVNALKASIPITANQPPPNPPQPITVNVTVVAPPTNQQEQNTPQVNPTVSGQTQVVRQIDNGTISSTVDMSHVQPQEAKSQTQQLNSGQQFTTSAPVSRTSNFSSNSPTIRNAGQFTPDTRVTVNYPNQNRNNYQPGRVVNVVPPKVNVRYINSSRPSIPRVIYAQPRTIPYGYPNNNNPYRTIAPAVQRVMPNRPMNYGSARPYYPPNNYQRNTVAYPQYSSPPGRNVQFRTVQRGGGYTMPSRGYRR